MLLRQTYRGRRVLVTGHTGFKGSWLCLWLQELGAEVSGYALEPESGPSLFRLTGLEKTMAHHQGDVRDFDRLSAWIKASRPEFVFHLAAQPLVRKSYGQPRETFETNVMGTVNVLEALRRTPGVTAAVMVTSDKCYENREWEWGYRENDSLGGKDPYSASKGAAEVVIQSYLRCYFDLAPSTALASARAGNVIGGGDFAEDRIIPDAVRAALAGMPLEVRNPDAVRPWQFVLESLSGYLMLGARLRGDRRFAGAWNFGPDVHEGATVREVATQFLAALGVGEWREASAQDGRRSEARTLRLCVDKAGVGLPWRPAYSARQAIKRTADWYREVILEGGDARAACSRDLAEYVREAASHEAGWCKEVGSGDVPEAEEGLSE